MLIYVGKNTKNKLNKIGIKTIGDLAQSNKYRIIKHLGKLGEQVYNYANGLDDDPVKYYYDKSQRKSVSKGITFSSDISEGKILEKELLKITSNVAFELRKMKLKASVISVTLKDSLFVSTSRQRKIDYSNSFDEISKNVIDIFRDNYIEGVNIRYICVGASGLKSEDEDIQLNMFNMLKNNEKIVKEKRKKQVTQVMDKLKDRYGDKIDYASVIRKD